MSQQKFLWGVATSAHQVEGGNFNNDWWQFEQDGYIYDHSSSHPSANQYSLFEKDIPLIKALGCNAYRFSIEWSRVEPTKGRLSQQEIAHYHRLIDCLIEQGIEPVLTLHHFTNPLWFVKRGGWSMSVAVDLFSRYVEKISSEFGDKVNWWITLNEPNVYLLLGFIAKYWPPLKKNPLLLIRAWQNMVHAHHRAYQIIHENDSQAKVSIAHHMSILEPWGKLRLDRISANIYDYLWNRRFLGQIETSLDFIGLNYYTRQRISFPFKVFPTPGKEVGFAQWEAYPEGLLRLCRDLQSYNKPIIITEYGMPADHSVDQSNYLLKGIGAIKEAREEDINIRGFFYWSLLDNFEWREGLSKRFGLYEVNYSTQRRRLRRVGRRYKELIREHHQL